MAHDAEAFAAPLTERCGLRVGAEDLSARKARDTARREWLPILGGSEGYLAMLTQDDAERAVAAALGAPAGIYSDLGDEPLIFAQVANTLGEVLSACRPKLPPVWLSKLSS